tara:strand:- start:1751 stop:2113 length:363 start_codon:yes stop_codon:yes gene_type:complete
MTVKVILMKSGEDVISDAQEIIDKDNKGIIAYHLKNPYVMQLQTKEVEEAELLVEGQDPTPKTKFQVSYTHWAPMSQQQEFVIPSDWVVTIYEPVDKIKTDYMAKHNIEEKDGNDKTPTT